MGGFWTLALLHQHLLCAAEDQMMGLETHHLCVITCPSGDGNIGATENDTGTPRMAVYCAVIRTYVLFDHLEQNDGQRRVEKSLVVRIWFLFSVPILQAWKYILVNQTKHEMRPQPFAPHPILGRHKPPHAMHQFPVQLEHGHSAPAEANNANVGNFQSIRNTWWK